MIQQLSTLFKTVTALIYLIPGLALFVSYVYPVNISKPILIGLCEVLGAIIILTALINKPQIIRKSKSRINRFVLFISILFIIFFLALAFFKSSFESQTYAGEKVLMPIKCNSPLCELIREAKQSNQEIGVLIGKDDLVERIDSCCKTEVLISEVIFDVLVIMIFNSLVLLFIVLGVYYSKQEKSKPEK